MVKELTLRRAGGSIGATLPKDMADRLHLEPGDRVLAVESENGILLTPYDPSIERALAIARRTAKKYVTRCANWQSNRCGTDAGAGVAVSRRTRCRSRRSATRTRGTAGDSRQECARIGRRAREASLALPAGKRSRDVIGVAAKRVTERQFGRMVAPTCGSCCATAPVSNLTTDGSAAGAYRGTAVTSRVCAGPLQPFVRRRSHVCDPWAYDRQSARAACLADVVHEFPDLMSREPMLTAGAAGGDAALRGCPSLASTIGR
jgi:antitoxin component of MazEF toxin-antitoxin module